jgi:methylated-DNA-[protein]-cysteine S-methyltransferase
MHLSTRTLDTPIGRVALGTSEDGLYCAWFGASLPAGVRGTPTAASERLVAQAADELTAYFAGDLTEFAVPVDLNGSSAFAREVLAAVAAVPYGTTATYHAIALTIGKPQAVRAVGRANATNPVPLVVPCHRIVGSDGSLTGYGGGLPAKRWLLDHEANTLWQ